MFNINKTTFFKTSKNQENPDMICAIKYNINICESIRDGLNGEFQQIPEIYVPSIHCIYNHQAIFYAEKPRYKKLMGITKHFQSPYIEIMLSKEQVHCLEQYLNDHAALKRSEERLHNSSELNDALQVLSPENFAPTAMRYYDEDSSCSIS